jgi:hypothetical protein
MEGVCGRNIEGVKMNYLLNDIEISIETLHRLMKGRKKNKESFRTVLEELWQQHNFLTRKEKNDTRRNR